MKNYKEKQKMVFKVLLAALETICGNYMWIYITICGYLFVMKKVNISL